MRKTDETTITYPAPMDSIENFDQQCQGNCHFIIKLYIYNYITNCTIYIYNLN